MSGATAEEGGRCKSHTWEPSYTVGGAANWHSHCGKQYAGSLKKLKIELPLLLLGHSAVCDSL